MKIRENVPLSGYATMRLGGPARFLTEVKHQKDLVEAANWALDQHLPILVLGGGSNVIIRDEGFPGLVIVNHLKGFDIIEDTPDGAVVRIGAGEVWDEVVAHAVRKDLSGIEALSLIPGSAGATPVQNVGAYGQEIADTFIELQAYDLATRQIVTIKKEDCGFAYRTSIFKPMENRHYIILNITLGLFKDKPVPPFYPRLQEMLDAHHIKEYTPAVIRDAVIAIRNQRLPNPEKTPNTGSFFKNPIVSKWLAADLKAKYPDMPMHDMPDGQVKIPAGWLLEAAGFKNYADYGMRTYAQNALVFVNENARNYQDLARFRDEISQVIQSRFSIKLEQEPELI
ncbi:MAG TPA: UDP-N-acetylmuramate dehydrogenase [Candidatus Saccharimonadales bacterium]|nr:UDP-N-acetylmuramate dehydrogenase [Candidatus Saccharimonadales bacterium]